MEVWGWGCAQPLSSSEQNILTLSSSIYQPTSFLTPEFMYFFLDFTKQA